MSAEQSHAPPLTAAAAPPGRIGMAIFLGSDATGFGGLLLAYAVLRVQAAGWPDPTLRFDRPLATVLTALLLASSATMTAAVAALRAGRHTARRWLLATASGANVAAAATTSRAPGMIRGVSRASAR